MNIRIPSKRKNASKLGEVSSPSVMDEPTSCCMGKNYIFGMKLMSSKVHSKCKVFNLENRWYFPNVWKKKLILLRITFHYPGDLSKKLLRLHTSPPTSDNHSHQYTKISQPLAMIMDSHSENSSEQRWQEFKIKLVRNVTLNFPVFQEIFQSAFQENLNYICWDIRRLWSF